MLCVRTVELDWFNKHSSGAKSVWYWVGCSRIAMASCDKHVINFISASLTSLWGRFNDKWPDSWFLRNLWLSFYSLCLARLSTNWANAMNHSLSTLRIEKQWCGHMQLDSIIITGNQKKELQSQSGPRQDGCVHYYSLWTDGGLVVMAGGINLSSYKTSKKWNSSFVCLLSKKVDKWVTRNSHLKDGLY